MNSSSCFSTSSGQSKHGILCFFLCTDYCPILDGNITMTGQRALHESNREVLIQCYRRVGKHTLDHFKRGMQPASSEKKEVSRLLAQFNQWHALQPQAIFFFNVERNSGLTRCNNSIEVLKQFSPDKSLS